MHSGCSGKFDDGKQIADKLRMMGFSDGLMPVPAEFDCECGMELVMDTFEFTCPSCGLVYAVNHCHAFDVENIKSAGKDY